MVGIADLMYGPGTAQAFAVPDPQASMAQILAGGTPAAVPAPAGSVATAFGDSPAPGAVAAAGAQANAAAAQEPGILDQARSWATKNPVQAQALMQGFAALAGGRTRGGFVQQLGQAAGVAGQTMIEQNAANSEQQRTQANKDRQFGLEKSSADSMNQARNDTNARANALHPGALEAQDQIAEGRDIANASAQGRESRDSQMFTPKMQMFKKQLDKLDSDLLSATTDREAAAIRLRKAKLETDIYAKFGEQEAQTILGVKAQQLTNAQEQGTREVIKTDEEIAKRDAIQALPEAERNAYYRGAKPKEHQNPAEIAKDLLKSDPMKYTKKDGLTDYSKLAADTNAIMRGGAPDPANQQAWEAARNAVKPGQTYTGPDGKEYTRK
jgi:hypothetical protein